MLRTYQEREQIVRIRARIDHALKTIGALEDQAKSSDHGNDHIDLEKGRIDLGGHLIKLLTSTFALNKAAHDPQARLFLRNLSTFLHQEEVEVSRNIFHFCERDLPRLDGTMVT